MSADIHNYLAQRLPVNEIPVCWNQMGYMSEAFNEDACSDSFAGWPGDLPTESEARVIATLLQVEPGGSMLDVACGYGRHAHLFAQQYGLRVSGIDSSAGLIEQAKAAGEAAHFTCADIRSVQWDSTYDYAIMVFNSLSLFSEADAVIVLDRIYSALGEGGRLFLDLDNKSFHAMYGSYDSAWYTTPNSLVLQETCFDEETSIETCRDIISISGSSAPREFITHKRIYSCQEICDLVGQAGMEVEQLYGHWDMSPWTEDSPKVILVGEKSS